MVGSSIIPNNTKPNISAKMKAIYLPSESHCMPRTNKGSIIIKLKLIFSESFIVNGNLQSFLAINEKFSQSKISN